MRANFALVCVAVIAASGCSSGSSKAAAPSTTRRDATSTPPVTARVKGTGSASTNPPATSPSSTTTGDTPITTATVPPTPATSSPPPAAENTTELTTAQDAVTARGFTPKGTADFLDSWPSGLHAIVAKDNARADGYAQRAFFFVHGRFVGTDQKEPSATVKLAWRSDNTIALSYAAYKTGEKLCCPTGGAIIVRYKWNGTRLKALDPIPPVGIRR